MKGARRFDNGTPPVLTAYIARAGMRMINQDLDTAMISIYLERGTQSDMQRATEVMRVGGVGPRRENRTGAEELDRGNASEGVLHGQPQLVDREARRRVEGH